MMAIYDSRGNLVWSQLLVDGEEVSTDELGIFGADDPEAPLLISHAASDSSTVGIVDTAFGPMITSSPMLADAEMTAEGCRRLPSKPCW